MAGHPTGGPGRGRGRPRARHPRRRRRSRDDGPRGRSGRPSSAGRRACCSTPGRRRSTPPCTASASSPGDEVITTSYTFAGTWQPILQQLAIPVFVDIDPRTFNLDAEPDRGEDHARGRGPSSRSTSAGCRPTWTRSSPSPIGTACTSSRTPARRTARRTSGRQVGSIGVVGCYSLNSSKILTGGEGGLFVADDPDVIARARRLRTFGEDIPELDRLTGWNFRPYTSHSVGWNYRHQEMPAALARSQLRRLPDYIATGQRNAAYLDEQLPGVPGITPPYVPRRSDVVVLPVSRAPRTGRARARARRSRRRSGTPSGRRSWPRASASSCGTRSPPRHSRSSRIGSGSAAVPVDPAAGRPRHHLRRGRLSPRPRRCSTRRS